MIGSYTFSEIAASLDGELLNTDVEFSEISTDSRTLKKGDLYLALKGEHFNGNEFVENAGKNGAIGAIVSEAIDASIPLLKVHDTHRALGDLARENRRRSNAKIIALTGSQGKTTVKEMVGSILSLRAKTLITAANLNNTIGVPLTLLKLKDHEFAVIEMGANGAGEIAFSVARAEPDIVLITKASAAHIEGFGSLQGIVEAKGEIIDGLGQAGIAVLNADDENVSQWQHRARDKRIVLFSTCEKQGSDYYASDINTSSPNGIGFRLNSPQGSVEISLNMMGEHNVANAVSASALALEMGAKLSDVAQGLAGLLPIDGRLKLRQGVNGSQLIDDTYNASPDSFFSAIEALMNFSGRRIVVAGDMNELGSESRKSHEQVGKFAASAGVDEFWSVGNMAKWSSESFGEKAVHSNDLNSLLDRCLASADDKTVFLIKGSRGARMEKIVNGLLSGEAS
ncbi:MAG: UDP-N-acetylmuramoyl-tripeptide--D-alanyl-D-alanine ligase [Pseudohongiellaceae bacterium]